ncbi:MAG: hypothetical protein ACKVQV_12715 [Bacteroidia bacterium]
MKKPPTTCGGFFSLHGALLEDRDLNWCVGGLADWRIRPRDHVFNMVKTVAVVA